MQPNANGRSILDDLALAARPARRYPLSGVSVGDLVTPVDEMASVSLQRPQRRSSLQGGALAEEATGRVMTELTLIESALQRAAVVSGLRQGEVLGVADACVVLAEASAPLSAEAADIQASTGTGSGLIRGAACRRRCRSAYADVRPAVHDICRAPVSRSASNARTRGVRLRGIAGPQAGVRGVALGRLRYGCGRPVSHYCRAERQRARRRCKPAGPAPCESIDFR